MISTLTLWLAVQDWILIELRTAGTACSDDSVAVRQLGRLGIRFEQPRRGDVVPNPFVGQHSYEERRETHESARRITTFALGSCAMCLPSSDRRNARAPARADPHDPPHSRPFLMRRRACAKASGSSTLTQWSI